MFPTTQACVLTASFVRQASKPEAKLIYTAGEAHANIARAARSPVTSNGSLIILACAIHW